MADAHLRVLGENRTAISAMRETRAEEKRLADDTVRNSTRMAASGRVTQGSFDGIRRSAERAGATIKSALSTGARYGGAALVGLTGIIGTLAAVSGFKFNALKENAQIAFGTMLKSGEKARVFLGELAKFAARTPFEFPDLLRASQRLLAAGFAAKQVLPIMTAVGNSVAAMGGDPMVMEQTIRAIGQVQAKGRLMAEEMMQLNEAGTFSWRSLAREIGTSVPKAMELVSKGAVSSDDFMEAFTRNSERNFGGMMDKQSHTVSGLFSTFKDTFNQIAGRVMMPFFNAARRLLEQTIGETGTKRFNDNIARLQQTIRTRIIPAFVDFAGRIKDAWPEIQRVLKSTVQFAMTAGRFLRGMATAAGKFSDAVGGWGNAAQIILSGVLALKLAGIAKSLGLVGAAAGMGPGGAGAKVATLRTQLGLLTRMGAIGILFDLIINKNEIDGWLESHGLGWTTKGLIRKGGALDTFGRFVNTNVRDRVLGRDRSRTALDTGTIGETPALDAARTAGSPSPDDRSFDRRTPTRRRPARKRKRTSSVDTPIDVGDGTDTSTTSGAGSKMGGPTGGDVAKFAIGAAASPGAKAAAFHLPGERTPYDCSAFTQAVFRRYGKSIGSTTYTQQNAGVAVARDQIQPGDLLFFTYEGERKPGHVGVYVGGGMMVHDHGKTRGVEHQAVDWAHFNFARRVIQAGASTGGAAAPTGTAPALAPAGAVRATRTRIGQAAERGERIASPELRTRVRNDIGALRKEIRNVVTQDDLDTVRKKLENVQGIIRRALSWNDIYRATGNTLKELRKRLSIVPDEISRSMLPGLRKLDKQWRNAITEDAIRAVQAKAKKMIANLDAILEKARQDWQDRQADFRDASSGIVDFALQAFDAQTDAMVEASRKASEVQTPAEIALEKFREARAQLQREASRTDLQEEMAVALRLGDPKLIRDAQRALTELDLDEQDTRLTAEAEASRKAADEAADLEEKRIRDERALVRRRFEARLQAVITGFEKEGGSYEDFMWMINSVLGDYGVDFATSGALLGAAFSEGFVDEVVKGANAAVQVLNALNQALGLQGIAPISPGFERFDPPIGKLPKGHVPMAGGGMVVKPTAAHLGEKRNREAVWDLDDPRSVAAMRQALGSGGGGGPAVAIYVEGMIHERDLGTLVRRANREWERRNARPSSSSR